MIKYKLSDDTWGSEEINAINEVIASNRFTMGEKTKQFEQKFADFIGSKYALMVNSGSSANLLAIAALVYSGKLNSRDEVIVPAVSWSTTYFPLFQHGLKLKFIDIDKETLNLDFNRVYDAITKKTKAIFAVNLLGNPNNFEKLQEICRIYNLLLIEDNCESLGAKYNNKYCGTFGIIGTFSTFFSHHICTMEGGVVVTDNEELHHYMLSIRAHGWTRDLPEYSMLYNKSTKKFYDSFNFIIPGYNLRPLEIQAAIGIAQIEKINNIISNRCWNANFFKELFKDNKNIITQKEIGKSSWFGFSILLKNNLKGKRDKIVERIEKKGIEVRPIVAGNFTRNNVIKYIDYEIHGELTNADYIHENGFFVGNHSKKIDPQISLLYKTLKD